MVLTTHYEHSTEYKNYSVIIGGVAAMLLWHGIIGYTAEWNDV